MGKFNEICVAYSKAITEYEKNETECGNFFNDLIQKMILYLEIPEDCFKIERNDDPKKYPSVIEFNDDGYWHSSLILTIYRPEEVYRKLPIRLRLKFKKNTNSTFTVYYGDQQTNFIIDLQQVESYNNFFDALYKEIADYFNNNFDDIFSSSHKQKYGFSI